MEVSIPSTNRYCPCVVVAKAALVFLFGVKRGMKGRKERRREMRG